MVLMLLADGFEEIEALTQVDFLRRAGVKVTMVGVEKKTVTGSHGIAVLADAVLDEAAASKEAEMVILPGGLGGVAGLSQSTGVAELLQKVHRQGGWLAAICAAPTLLAARGFLGGCTAACYPGCEEQFPADVAYTDAAVHTEEAARVVTARSVGVSGAFSVELVRILRGQPAAEKLKASLYANW